jgi:hypothetical protein
LSKRTAIHPIDRPRFSFLLIFIQDTANIQGLECSGRENLGVCFRELGAFSLTKIMDHWSATSYCDEAKDLGSWFGASNPMWHQSCGDRI